MEENNQPREGEIIFYTTPEGVTKVEVFFQDETFWLTINRMAELFSTSKQDISYHLQQIYESGELKREATVKEILTVQLEGNRNVSRKLEFYNLDAIIAVGYRVNSLQATQFRIWATVTPSSTVSTPASSTLPTSPTSTNSISPASSMKLSSCAFSCAASSNPLANLPIPKAFLPSPLRGDCEAGLWPGPGERS